MMKLFSAVTAVAVFVTSPVSAAMAQADDYNSCVQGCRDDYSAKVSGCFDRWGQGWDIDREFCIYQAAQDADTCQEQCQYQYSAASTDPSQLQRFRPVSLNDVKRSA
jgi:hypothetical protein